MHDQDLGTSARLGGFNALVCWFQWEYLGSPATMDTNMDTHVFHRIPIYTNHPHIMANVRYPFQKFNSSLVNLQCGAPKRYKLVYNPI